MEPRQSFHGLRRIREGRIRLMDALQRRCQTGLGMRRGERLVEFGLSVVLGRRRGTARDRVAAWPARPLEIGEVVRSTGQYWKETGRSLSGSIVRLEPVPDVQVAAAGSCYWAYLNTGEGPVSLSCLERCPVKGGVQEAAATAPEGWADAGSNR
jgi:hypothetical protein